MATLDGRPGHFDEAALSRRLGDDAESVEALLSAFAADAPGLLIKLQDAVSRLETGQVRQLAHSIKGSLLWIGAEPAASFAGVLEQKASTGTATISALDLADLLGSVEALLTELRERKSASPD